MTKSWANKKFVTIFNADLLGAYILRAIMPVTKKTAKKTAPVKAIRKSAGKNFLPVFAALCELLAPWEDRMKTQTDKSGFWMHSLEPTFRDKPMFFAGIRMGKNYVSFHLMPVYCCPELNKMSPALQQALTSNQSLVWLDPSKQTVRTLIQTYGPVSSTLTKAIKTAGGTVSLSLAQVNSTHSYETQSFKRQL